MRGSRYRYVVYNTRILARLKLQLKLYADRVHRGKNPSGVCCLILARAVENGLGRYLRGKTAV